ncbi:hypothetical protein BJ508DRAFT_84128 [Ascobolus immersus RN42]|uniref:Uncharacterized protein n=1 Tax=Ascobolus immersus RN42 TaxID=1160509 RepID=A0A3N4I9M4_ASCIM|nr:hypothetical protein BJ508DRAFT_84128 [Ascobolus immersus RN42]
MEWSILSKLVALCLLTIVHCSPHAWPASAFSSVALRVNFAEGQTWRFVATGIRLPKHTPSSGALPMPESTRGPEDPTNAATTTYNREGERPATDTDLPAPNPTPLLPPFSSGNDQPNSDPIILDNEGSGNWSSSPTISMGIFPNITRSAEDAVSEGRMISLENLVHHNNGY